MALTEICCILQNYSHQIIRWFMHWPLHQYYFYGLNGVTSKFIICFENDAHRRLSYSLVIFLSRRIVCIHLKDKKLGNFVGNKCYLLAFLRRWCWYENSTYCILQNRFISLINRTRRSLAVDINCYKMNW